MKPVTPSSKNVFCGYCIVLCVYGLIVEIQQNIFRQIHTELSTTDISVKKFDTKSAVRNSKITSSVIVNVQRLFSLNNSNNLITHRLSIGSK